MMQGSRIDDYWNIDGSRDLSDCWTGFTQFILLEEKPPDGFLWSGRRLTKRQVTSRPDHLWPELWTKMGRNAKLKEKQKWSHEKLHLENARKLRGIYFIDPEEKEFKENIKNARKKLETPVAPVACILEGDCVWESHCRIIMKTILQEEETTHNSITIWFTKFSPMPQAMKIPAAKAAVDKEWRNWRKFRRRT